MRRCKGWTTWLPSAFREPEESLVAVVRVHIERNAPALQVCICAARVVSAASVVPELVAAKFPASAGSTRRSYCSCSPVLLRV